MRPNAQLPTDLVTFTEEILKGKLHFLCSVDKSLCRAVYTAEFEVKNK